MSGPRKTIIAFFIKRLLVDARQQCWIRAKGQIDMTCLQRRGHFLPTQSESAEARAWSFIPHCVIKRCQHDQLTDSRASYHEFAIQACRSKIKLGRSSCRERVCKYV